MMPLGTFTLKYAAGRSWCGETLGTVDNIRQWEHVLLQGKFAANLIVLSIRLLLRTRPDKRAATGLR
jgi:hypothetical protein